MEKDQIPSHAPAPWALTGSGYILLFRFSREFIRRQGLVPESMQPSFRGGFGTVMYVDYLSSDVGPYRELLFIPGAFDFSGRTYYSITRIYVSTLKSVREGRNNWGIPKELASFEATMEPGGMERVRVRAESGTIAEFLFRSRPVSLPVTTAVVPAFLRTLGHRSQGRTLLTAPRARGSIAPAQTLEIRTDGSLFPPVERAKRIGTVRVPHFFMVFPPARVMEQGE